MMDNLRYYMKALEQLEFDVQHDTYLLTRDDISSIQWRIDDLKRTLDEVYSRAQHGKRSLANE